MATESRHNSASQTRSGLPQCDSRQPVSAEPAHHRVESLPRSRESDIQTVGNSSSGHVCHSPQYASSPVHVSSSGALSNGDRYLVTGLEGEVDVIVSTVSPAHKVFQKLRTTQTGEVILIAPCWPSQPWFPHLLRLGVDHPRLFQYLTRGLYLELQVVPSACMEGLMQHY